MQTACWQFLFSDRFTGARNPARLSTTIRSRRIRYAPSFFYNCTLMGSVVADPALQKRAGDQLTPQYHVVLLNDDDHSYEYVIEMLQKLFACTESSAWNHAVEVDT